MPTYSKDARRDAADIARDVIATGRSTWWSGERAQCEAVERLLAPFGIVYLDDMRGEWGPSRAVRDAIQALHAGAPAGRLCFDDDGDGCCDECGVSLADCDRCNGIGYHADGCPHLDGEATS